MGEGIDWRLHRAVGLSDLASLLATGFSFPDGKLAQALSNGAFLDDWRASIVDACGGESAGDVHLSSRCAAAFAETDEGLLRREYSRLFLAPGVDVSIWPYESPFLHRMVGAQGAPSLFRTRISMDVERCMAAAGVATVDLRREPVDSVFHELEFLAYLHACIGEALRVGNGDAEREWRDRLCSFANDHALKWLPAFMQKVDVSGRAESLPRWLAPFVPPAAFPPKTFVVDQVNTIADRSKKVHVSDTFSSCDRT